MVDQFTATPIQQPQIEGTDWSFTAPDKQISKSTPTNQESLKWRPIKIKLGPSPRQQITTICNINNKAVTPQDWQLTVELSLVEDETL